MAVAAGAAQTRGLTDLNGSHVGDTHHQAVAVGHRRLRQILDGLRQGVCADGQGLTRTLDIARARLSIGAVQRLNQVVEAQAIAGQACRIGADSVFLHIAAVDVHARQTGRGPHTRCDDPVLNGP